MIIRWYIVSKNKKMYWEDEFDVTTYHSYKHLSTTSEKFEKWVSERADHKDEITYFTIKK